MPPHSCSRSSFFVSLGASVCASFHAWASCQPRSNQSLNPDHFSPPIPEPKWQWNSYKSIHCVSFLDFQFHTIKPIHPNKKQRFKLQMESCFVSSSPFLSPTLHTPEFSLSLIRCRLLPDGFRSSENEMWSHLTDCKSRESPNTDSQEQPSLSLQLRPAACLRNSYSMRHERCSYRLMPSQNGKAFIVTDGPQKHKAALHRRNQDASHQWRDASENTKRGGAYTVAFSDAYSFTLSTPSIRSCTSLY